MLISSTRLYDAAPAARVAWHDLLALAYARAGLDVTFIEHAWPAPVEDLWRRSGLCAAFMCGWPYAQALQRGEHFQAVAAVVPDWPAYEGMPRYRSEFLVRAQMPWEKLADALGSRYGWMVQGSQSGWNAPRATLSQYVRAGLDRQRLFAASRGPYGTPRALVYALREGEIDLTAVDGWYLDLLRAHEPATLSGLRTLAYTSWTPNPLLVCSPDVASDTAAKIARELCALQNDPEGLQCLRAAHVARLEVPRPSDYDVTLHDAQRALSNGYAEIR